MQASGGTKPESYDEEYYLGSRYADQGLGSQYYWARRFYAAMVRRYASGGKLLEVGCGLGAVLERLQDDFDTYAIDVSPFAVGEAAKRAPRAHVSVGDAGSILSFGEGAFDVIVAIHVVEHLERPQDFFEAARAVLRPGGLMFIGTPNLSSPSRRIKGKRWFAYQDPTHISMKTAREWLRLIREQGFSVRKAFGDGLWDVPYVPMIPAKLQLALVGLPAVLQTLLCVPFLPAAVSESLLVVAHKPREIASAGGNGG